MPEIKLTLEIPGLVEALRQLAGSIAGKRSEMAVAEPQTVEVPASTNNQSDTTTKPTVPVQGPETASEQSPVSFADISRAGAMLCGSGKTDDLVNLLHNKYQVAAITELAPDRYNDLAADLRAMGAQI